MHLESDAARIARESEVPPEARELAESLSRDHERRQREAAEALERAIDQSAERVRAQLHDLMGRDIRRDLRDLKRRERLALQERMQPPRKAGRDFDAENRVRKANVDSFLHTHGISAQRFKDTAREHFRHVGDLFDVRPRTTGEAIAVRFHHGVFDEWRKGPFQEDPHRWFRFTPPFEGGQWGFGVSRSPQKYRVAVYRDLAVDLDAGLVGHNVHIDIIDASDVDTAHGTADTQVAFWFQAPTTGLVEVLIEAQSGLATHDLRVSDEWGTSDSDTRQSNFLMMHVLHPNVTAPSLALMSNFPAMTDNSNTYHHEFLTQGGDFAARLFSDGPVSANQWMMIRAGTRTDDWTMTNDMEVHSTSSFRWFIKRVNVRIAP